MGMIHWCQREIVRIIRQGLTHRIAFTTKVFILVGMCCRMRIRVDGAVFIAQQFAQSPLPALPRALRILIGRTPNAHNAHCKPTELRANERPLKRRDLQHDSLSPRRPLIGRHSYSPLAYSVASLCGRRLKHMTSGPFSSNGQTGRRAE